MFSYEKMLQYPVNIKNPNPKYAQIVLEQYGGPDGELGASLRYLSQRFSSSYLHSRPHNRQVPYDIILLSNTSQCVN